MVNLSPRSHLNDLPGQNVKQHNMCRRQVMWPSLEESTHSGHACMHAKLQLMTNKVRLTYSPRSPLRKNRTMYCKSEKNGSLFRLWTGTFIRDPGQHTSTSQTHMYKVGVDACSLSNNTVARMAYNNQIKTPLLGL